MNEIQLIRGQLSVERERATTVVQAVAAALAGAGAASGEALGELRRTSADYLSWVLTRFEERDQRLRQRYAQRPGDDPDRRAAEGLLADGGGSAGALERLGQERWPDLARFLTGPWRQRREAVERLLAGNPRVADWRAIGGVDADSILGERQRYARVLQHLPPGAAPADR